MIRIRISLNSMIRIYISLKLNSMILIRISLNSMIRIHISLKLNSMIRIRISLNSTIRLHISLNSMIRIHISLNSMIQIGIKLTRIMIISISTGTYSYSLILARIIHPDNGKISSKPNWFLDNSETGSEELETGSLCWKTVV